MSILKNISIGLSRGLPSPSSRGKSSRLESKKHSEDGLTETQRNSLQTLKSRLLDTLIRLCGSDQMLQGMVRKLVVPILSGLTQAQIEEGASFIHGEIEALRDAGLIELGATTNREERQGNPDRSDGMRQDAVSEISS
jgi:hypothetical protein